MTTKRKGVVGAVVFLALMMVAAVGQTYEICISQGGCHVCKLYSQNGDPQGTIIWGCS